MASVSFWAFMVVAFGGISLRDILVRRWRREKAAGLLTDDEFKQRLLRRVHSTWASWLSGVGGVVGLTVYDPLGLLLVGVAAGLSLLFLKWIPSAWRHPAWANPGWPPPK